MDERFKNLEAWRGRRVVAAMSGGVDSSLAATLLHRAGAEVIGVRMRLFGGPERSDRPGVGPAAGFGVEPATPDELDAAHVARRLGITFHVLPLHAEFHERVVAPFVREYLAGRTPNPCVICNRRIKMGALLEAARALGAEAVATGHYARLAVGASGRAELLAAADRLKDQSYYLARLTQDQLRRLVMPLGAMTKGETRALARDLGLHVHDKTDSLEICFIPDNDYRRFLREAAPAGDPAASGGDAAGEIVNARGEV
ncbi:MAG: tRNA 2-thiouridine(34) synthase MnmA, partial [bacterium]|nr:tRNA 2-thiouridine(34) synthase MnmA [bacterium]